MWTSIERGLDGMVGRMLSWLTHPSTQASSLEEVADALDEAKKEAAAPVTAAASIEDGLEPDAAAEPQSVEPQSAEAEQTRELLRALERASGGVSMKQLQQATGGTPHATRQRLNRLIRSGRVQRKGKGMRTRYHLAGD